MMAGLNMEQKIRSGAARYAFHGLSLPRPVLNALHKRGIIANLLSHSNTSIWQIVTRFEASNPAARLPTWAEHVRSLHRTAARYRGSKRLIRSR